MVLHTPKLKNILIVDDDDEYNFITEDIFQDTNLNCNLVFKLWATLSHKVCKFKISGVRL